jgi:hypothetical protein
MFYALSWFAVASLIALWSLAAWFGHAVAAWTIASAGALSGAASAAGPITLPAWLSPWVPPQAVEWVSDLVAGLGPLIDRLLQAAPALADGLAVAAWVVWGTGSVLLLLLGAGMHLLIALARRRAGKAGPGAGPSLAVG